MPPRRNRQRDRARRRDRQQERRPRGSWGLPYAKRNVRFFIAGIVVILLGYFFLAQPPVDGFLSLTLAPILLLIGYCVLVPIAVLISEGKKPDEEGEATT